MTCEGCREALSARLDGEDTPSERVAADAHLAACDGCRDWFAAAASVTRLVRTPVPVPAGAGIPDSVLDAAPGPWRARLATGLRWGLGGLAAAQFVLGMTQVATFAGQTHVHDDQVASAGHLWHESAAWNFAVAAAFGLVAVSRLRPGALVPVLTVFVAALVVLSFNDLTTGRVQAAWLLSHGFLLTGYALIMVLSRPRFDFGDPPTPGRRDRWPLGTVEPDRAPRWSGPVDLPGAPAARHRDAA